MANGHGGARSGSGRLRITHAGIETNGDPAAFLVAIMRDTRQDLATRMRAAALLMPFKHPKLGAAPARPAVDAEAERRWARLLADVEPAEDRPDPAGDRAALWNELLK